ncbi:MAG: glycosyltransferase, partial [Vicinamibacterales bacterium]
EVRLCTSPNFIEWARRLGLEAVPMGVEMRMPSGRSSTAPTLTPDELRRLQALMPDLITDQFETVGATAEGCDVIIGANAHQYAAPSIAEVRGIGCVTAVYAPVAVPTPDLPPPPPPGQPPDAPSSMSIEAQWQTVVASWNERALDRINQNRERLGLGPVHDVLDYVLTKRTWLAADARLAPVPGTPGRQIVQTGTWVLPDYRPLPADLEAFLSNGEPPVYAGFGSMPTARDISRCLVDAARAVGRRAIVSKGWADLDVVDVVDGAADCIAVGDVSHHVLFPRVAAVIHHGGAGTTAAAARAGVPQVVTPMFGDQFYWASRVVDLGLGATVPHASMTADSLAHALQVACGGADGARRLAGQVGTNGAEVAAQQLEREYGLRR